MKILLLIMFVFMALGYLRGTIMWIKSVKAISNDNRVSKKLLKELGITKTSVMMWGVEYPIFLLTVIIAFFYVLNH